MTREEAKELKDKIYNVDFDYEGDDFINKIYDDFENKIEETENKWHKVADGDLPEVGGNYWCKLKGEYDQGSSHYKQHCTDGYCILQWLHKKKKWNVRYNTEVEAWVELPKYKED